MKITDFGLARYFGSPTRDYTHQVVTRWYRCPELLYRARAYGVGVDMWSVGCIIAELLLRVPFFPGESDMDQLVKIFNVLGAPTDDDWPARKELPDFIEINGGSQGPVNFRSVFSAASDSLIDLMKGLFRFDPLQRLNATEALNSTYFREEPYPCNDEELPVPRNENSTNYGKQVLFYLINFLGNRKRRVFADGESPPVRRNLFN